VTQPEVSITVVRHGSTELTSRILNGGGRGAADPPLDPTGISQVLTTRRALLAAGVLSEGAVEVRCSPALRARQSAALLVTDDPESVVASLGGADGSQHLEGNLVAGSWPDARLGEVDFGQWEGLSPAAVFATDDGARWAADPTRSTPAGGSIQDLARDFAELRSELMLRGGRWLLVAHAGTVRVAAAAALGLPLAQVMRIAVPPGGWVHTRWWLDGGSVLEFLG